MPASTGLFIELFLKFLKIGIIGFGGGWAILPIIQREIVEDAGWISENEYYDLVAIAGSTPGPVAVNAATYIGYRLGGVAGALVATTAVIIPPITIILLIAYSIQQVITNPITQTVLDVLKAGITGLIALALYSMLREIIRSSTTPTSFTVFLLIIVSVIVLIGYFHIHPIIVILALIGVGITIGILGFRF